jgi:hypothetical protein
MDEYQQLKEVIQKANPEIMELKFGCEVEGYKSVIGRPIRLTDVLIALNLRRDTHMKDWFAVNTYGLFLENKVKEITARPYAHPMISALYSWNLKDDNLDHQSEECKEFLTNLLI